MADEFDVITIGGGPGGYVAAIRAAQLGLKTACVEAETLGGVCLNWGCIPNKVLLTHAEMLSQIRHQSQELGLRFEGFEADYSVAVEQSRRVVRRLVGGVGHLFKKYGVTHIKGYGTLADANTVEVEGTPYRAGHIVLATGATWNRLSDVGAEGEEDGERVVAYRDAILQKEIPGSIIVVGGGIIGVEFAFTLNAYGAKVTLIEQSPHLLPRDDVEVAQGLAAAFRKQGIEVRTGTALRKVERVGDGVRVVVAPADGGGPETLAAERVLLAIGVKPNSANLGLERAGVEVDERGRVVIDASLRTTVPHILAVGDVTGKRMLASVASHMGLVAAETIAGQPHAPLNFKMMPRAAYCQPQTLSIGYTEEDLKAQGVPYRVGRFPLIGNGKALAMNGGDGFVKALAHAEGDEILGLHMLGPEAGELAAEFTLARELDATPAEWFGAVHPHPTISEAVAEAVMGAVGQTVNV